MNQKGWPKILVQAGCLLGVLLLAWAPYWVQSLKLMAWLAPAEKPSELKPENLTGEERKRFIKDIAARIASGDSTAQVQLSQLHNGALNCDVAWLLCNMQYPKKATDLFAQSLSWGQEEEQAKQGLFYCIKGMGDGATAADYFEKQPPPASTAVTDSAPAPAPDVYSENLANADSSLPPVTAPHKPHSGSKKKEPTSDLFSDIEDAGQERPLKVVKKTTPTPIPNPAVAANAKTKAFSDFMDSIPLGSTPLVPPGGVPSLDSSASTLSEAPDRPLLAQATPPPVDTPLNPAPGLTGNTNPPDSGTSPAPSDVPTPPVMPQPSPGTPYPTPYPVPPRLITPTETPGRGEGEPEAVPTPPQMPTETPTQPPAVEKSRPKTRPKVTSSPSTATVDDEELDKPEKIPRKMGPDDLNNLALKSYQKKHYEQALELLAMSEKKRPLSRGMRMIRAWCFYNIGDYDHALELFKKLYKQKRDTASAQGLLLSAKSSSRLDELNKDHSINRGTMATNISKALAQEYYDRALYLSAHAEDLTVDPGLANLTTPSIGAAAAAREKDGQGGLGRVEELVLPALDSTFTVTPVDEFHVQLERLTLSSGSLDGGAKYGTAPVVPTLRKFAAATNYPNLLVPEIDFLHQGMTSYRASLGLTPLNSVVGPLPTGVLGVTQQVTGGGFYTVEGYSQSNQESLLSYAGARDPYTGKTWGRVVEAGIRSSGYLPLWKKWGVYAQGGAAALVGKHTKHNNHTYISLNLGRNIDVRGFQYLTLGPTLSLDHFDNNQDNYTYGQGGYFSPDVLIQGGLSMSFLTQESQRFIADGYASAGFQHNYQASAPVLPLSPDGRTYDSTSDTSLVFAAHIRAAYLLTDHWELGGFASYGKSANYNEAEAGVTLRYYFDPRAALFESDLPLIFK